MIPRHRITRRSDQPSTQQVLHGITFAFFTAAALALLLIANLSPRVYEYHEGDVSQANVKSPRKVTFTSQVRTRAERERSAAAIPDQLVTSPELMDRQRQALNTLLQSIASTRASLSPDQRRESIRRLGNPPFSDSSTELLSTLDDKRLSLVFQDAQRLRLEAMRERLTDGRAQEVIRQLPSLASETLTEPERALAADLAGRFIRSNLVVDGDTTAKLREDARAAVAPVQVTVEAGEIILREGQVVTAADLEKLEALGFSNPTASWRGGLAGALLALILVAALSGYVYAFQPALLARDKRLLLISTVMIVTVLAAKIVIPGRPLWVYVFPLPAVAMLLSALLDARLAIFASGLLGTLVTYVAGGSLEYIVLFGAASSIAATVVWRQERGHAFFIAGLLAALVQFGTVVVFMLVDWSNDWALLGMIAFECLVNGLGSAILAAGGVMLLGRVFGITTTWQLLELTNNQHPLLRRLMYEAPGTYHHSLIVGNLAERLAEDVGADPLLARVVSYYHDIGKLRRPQFFIENQTDGFNPHERLEPRDSARIIAAHVNDGVEIARQYGLPPRICEMIPQHHGTRLVSFFFQQATEEGKAEARVGDYTYPGPKPQTKEAAIVMIADSCEAAARASRDHSPEAIDALVEKILMQRLSEGQFDECDLTLRDVQRIKQASSDFLRGMYHPRIEYPQPEALEPAATSVSAAPDERPVRALPNGKRSERPSSTNGAHPEDAAVPGTL